MRPLPEMLHLTRLPPEILHNVLSFVEPGDLSSLLRTCRQVHDVVLNNGPLHKAIYLRTLDEPLTSDLDWEKELHDLVRLQRICASRDPEKKSELPFVYDVVTRLLRASARGSSSATRTSNSTTHPPSRNAALLASLFACGEGGGGDDDDGPSSSSAGGGGGGGGGGGCSSNRDAFMCRSFIFERARAHVRCFVREPPSDEHQMSARLHVLYGVLLHGLGSGSGSCGGDYCCGTAGHDGGGDGPSEPLLGSGSSSSGGRHRQHQHQHQRQHQRQHQHQRRPRPRTRSSMSLSRRMYPFACSRVYDLRQHTDETMWGPFLADGSGRVDWERLESVMMVLKWNIEKKGMNCYPIFRNYWSSPFPGVWPDSYIPMPRVRELGPLELVDPYDVSGTWLRVVCFLDYNDFFRYNFPVGDQLPDNVPRPAREMNEATRLILMKIHITRIDPPEQVDGDRDGKGMPVVHFEGLSRSLDGTADENANSDLRGTCRLTPDGEVRWTTFSIFSGDERWRSEGVQIGGPRSARGVIGNWFDRNYDPSGPCGPTAFWKISDRQPGSDDDTIVLSDFLPLVDEDDEELDGEWDENADVPFEEVMPEILPFSFPSSGEETSQESDSASEEE